MAYETEYIKTYERTYKQAYQPLDTSKSATPRTKLLVTFWEKFRELFIKLFNGVTSLSTLYLLTGFLLGRAEVRGGLIPLVLAYLLALRLEKASYFSAAFIGSLIGIQLTHGIEGTVTVIIPAMIYLLWERRSLGNKPKIGTVIFVASFMVTSWFYGGLPGSFPFNLLPLAIEGGLLVIFAVLLMPGLQFIESKRKTDNIEKEEIVSIILLASMAFMGLQGIMIGPYSIPRLVSLLAVLIVGYRYGGGQGAAAGAILGTITSFYSLSQISIGALTLSGLLAGIFKDFGKLSSTFAFIFSSGLVVFYLGEPFVMLHFLQEILIISVIFLVIPERFFYKITPSPISHGSKMVSDRKMDQIINHKFYEFASLFSDMAKVFEPNSNEQDYHDSSEIEDFVQTVVNQVCGGCSKVSYCWEKNFFVTYKNFLNVISKVDSGKKLHRDELPEYLQESCIRPSLLLENAGSVFDDYQLEHNKAKSSAAENKKLLSEQMFALSELFNKMAKFKVVDSSNNRELEQEIRSAIENKNFVCEEICVTGKVQEDLTIELIINCSGTKQEDIKEISTLVSEVVGEKLSPVTWDLYREDSKINNHYFIRLRAEQQLQVITGCIQINKEGEPLSGDTYMSRELSTGEHLLLLSDGMGSGSKANEESEATVNLITKLLNYGYDKQMVIRSVNSLLATINRVDSFATVDMALIDLYTGIGEFCKAGAVSSFISTAEGVEKVEASSLPAGIIESVEPKKMTYSLKPGDYLYMVSDGVFDMGDGEKWFEKAISNLKSKDPQEMAEELLEKVKRRYSYGDFPDDVTILIAKITSNSKESELDSQTMGLDIWEKIN
ncbi:stage II sporulation protein E [Natranaerobius thermophilus]|uniref:Stage II sporulation protein E, protein serine/threonine phosphatase n=1 Tax=Natranaerobius thermophilus (strain ATCC BAA-1301 / DSM 18059 / JW/NM-WN-LF) TaxID=457570 RepID=B2A3Q1_NATTJ|nr:stage II sporulation protein E [Natranaerobius thermophilus]ACB83677.1 stage II sporulation protein E, protein serine/threonine phosphatase [Natranaerobius thermophilus JW/NM-WN-LF]